MKNEISFFEFFLFLWSKKIFIFLFSLFFLLLGFIISYYEHKNKNYRGSIIIYAIGDIESIPTNNLKITSAERFCSKNIDENILECAPFNYYLDIENVRVVYLVQPSSVQTFSSFSIVIQSIQTRS